MKKTVLTVLGVIMITSIVFAGSAPVKAELKEGGFSLMIPSEWTVDETELQNGSLFIATQMKEYMGFYFQKLKGDYKTVKKNLEKSFINEAFEPIDAGSVKPKSVKKASCSKVNGIEVCSAEFKYDLGAGLQKTYFGVFQTKKGAYKVIFSTDEGTYNKLIAKIKKIIKTMKLIK
ncbi:MAG: hypothetical protein A2014_03110 [Spirochaetes bacterium GWF1_49_6]|nr:MAG: hypothetical protein A2014_03110 [Spirochaetes bacterium GWF1_49_6]